MRGSFCQALPIGCIRVFITPSCSSAVTLESRCSGALEVGVLVPADDFQELIAGEDQLGNGGHEAIERLDIDADRLARQPFAWVGICALGSGGGGCASLVGAAAAAPSDRRSRRSGAGGTASLRGAAPQSPIRASRQPIETFD